MQTRKTVRQFEYRIVQLSNLTEIMLNELGMDGWELVCAIQSIMFGNGVILKREKSRDAERVV